MKFRYVKSFRIKFDERGYARPSFNKSELKFENGQKVVLYISVNGDEYLIKKAEDVNVGQ